MALVNFCGGATFAIRYVSETCLISSHRPTIVEIFYLLALKLYYIPQVEVDLGVFKQVVPLEVMKLNPHDHIC